MSISWIPELMMGIRLGQPAGELALRWTQCSSSGSPIRPLSTVDFSAT
jgi:hypothetical protein